MDPDILVRMRAAYFSINRLQKDLALTEAVNEIVALRMAIRRFGDKTRMATVEPMFLQQVIDRAMVSPT